MVVSIVKTYLWIAATAISRKNKIRRTDDRGLIIVVVDLLRAIRMCPAVMLAARRTANVIGRIICLILSIKTMNWDSGSGVLKGTKWLRKWALFLVSLKSTIPNHSGKAAEKVISMWAVRVNTNGMRPDMFSAKILINNDSRIFSLPLILGFLKVAFSSCSMKLTMEFI